MCKILDFSGATRYDNINEHITHCIVGNPDCHELKLIRNKGLLHFPVVSVNWLFACIEQEQPVNEEKFIINFVSTPVEQSSPLSQKVLFFFQHSIFIYNFVIEGFKFIEKANFPSRNA